jgi:hypothetical protein
VGLFRPLVRRRSDGTFIQAFPPHIPDLLVHLSRQLDEMVDSDAPEVRRLFPTAYPNDPERDAGYQILARDGLIEARREAIAVVQATADNEVLTEDELMAWMGVANDLRLVIGTRLDVSEDDEGHEPEGTPEYELRQIYDLLGAVVHEIIRGLS